jgi:hypothetical protein
MKFTKAQSAIIEEIGNTNEVSNYSQRMRAIQPLLDAQIISRSVIYDNDGLSIGYRWELI